MPERRVEGEEAETEEALEIEEAEGRSLGREECATPGAMIEVLEGKFKEEEERDTA